MGRDRSMACIANATGLVPDILACTAPTPPATRWPRFIPKADGGILDKKGVVDFTIGKGVAPGACIVEGTPASSTHDDSHRPWPHTRSSAPPHLAEVPLTAARIMLYGKPDMVPLPAPVAEVCAVAKRDLSVGETFDAIGETCYRSWTMTVTDARDQRAIPVGLLEGGKVTAPVKKGDLLTHHNAAPDPTTRLFALRRKQDEMLGTCIHRPLP